MRKTKVVRGVAIFAISTGLSLWNMESQEVVALAPVSIESSLKSRVQLWQESLPAADAASVTCKIKKLDHVRKIRVRQYEQELKRIREENARRKRMLEIRKYCGVNITDSDRVILEKIVQAEAGNQDHQGKLLVANVILNRVKTKSSRQRSARLCLHQDSFHRSQTEAMQRRVPRRIPKRQSTRHCTVLMAHRGRYISWTAVMRTAEM